MPLCRVKPRAERFLQPNSRPLSSKFRRLVEENARQLSETIEFKPFEEIGYKEELYLRTIDEDAHRSVPIKVDELLKCSRKDTGALLNACNHVCVTGSRGIGKTTLLSTFIEMAQHGNASGIDPEVDLVHWINCSSPSRNDPTSVARFLFGAIEMTEAELQDGYKWMLNNPTKVIFVLDNLDFVLNDLKRFFMGPYDHSTPQNIVLNLLEGSLFVGCSVLSTCDENYYDYLTEEDNRVDVMTRILLCGLPRKAVDRIALKYLGDVGYRESFVHFKHTSPYVITLCENPTILAMTLIGLSKEAEGQSVPKGMCGIAVNLLLKIAGSRGHVLQALNKLKEAAYKSKRKSKEILTKDILEDVGLSKEDITEVSIIKSFRILTEENDGGFKFANPLMQDIFSSLYVAESDWEEFKSATSAPGGLSSIVRFAFGFVLDENIFKKTLELFEPGSQRITQITNNRGKKCKRLKSIACDAIANMEYSFEVWEQFSVLHAIAEGGRELKESVFRNFSQFTMGRFGCLLLHNVDMCALAVSICHTVDFYRLAIRDCCLPASLLEFLHETILDINCSTKIRSFHCDLTEFQVGRSPDEADVNAFSRFLIHVTELFNLNGWTIGKNQEDHLQDRLDDIQAINLKILINQHDVLTAQSTWCDVAQGVISRDGGSVQLNDCGLDFSKGTLAGMSKVMIEMKNYEKGFPEDYIVLSPTMHVGVSADLLKAVLVNMRAWCVLDDDKWSSTSVKGEILHLEDGGDHWRPNKTVDLSKTSNVQFKCKSFSKIVVAIKLLLAPMFVFPLTALICSKGGIWGVAFCLDHKSTKKETDDELRKNTYKELCPFVNTIFTKIGDVVEIRLKVSEPEGFYLDINSDNWPKFTLTKKFVRHPRFRFNTFFLKNESRRRRKCTVRATFDTFLNGNKEEDGGGVLECDVSGLDTEQVERLEDVFHNIVTRFSSPDEFRKFAISGDGFCLDMNKVTEIRENYPKMYDQQLEMLKIWKGKQGAKATPKKLRTLVESYFDKVPDADKAEQLQLEDVFEKAMSDFNTYRQWTAFARSEYGLDLDEMFIEEVIGGQQNITKGQKKIMLDGWKKCQANEASAKRFREIVCEYNRFFDEEGD